LLLFDNPWCSEVGSARDGILATGLLQYVRRPAVVAPDVLHRGRSGSIKACLPRTSWATSTIARGEIERDVVRLREADRL